MIDDYGSTHPIIDSADEYGSMGSKSCCLSTPIIVIAVDYGKPCEHAMCVACTTNVGGITINLLVSVMSGSGNLFCEVI